MGLLLVVFVFSGNCGWNLDPVYAGTIGRVTKVKILPQDAHTIRITWKRIKGTNTYQIYRAAKKQGPYKKIKKTRKRSFFDRKRVPGKRYWYQIRACRGKSKGPFSRKNSGMSKPETVTGLKVEQVSAQCLNISWKRIKGATAYQLYRSTSKRGSYKKIGKVKSTNYQDSQLQPETTYFYKVRACRGNVYGKFSTRRSGRTPGRQRQKVTVPKIPKPDPSLAAQQYLKILDMETGQEVQELRAGEDYLLSSSSLYAMSTSETYGADSQTKAMSYCHITPQKSQDGTIKALLSPVLAGTLYFQNEDGMERSYPIAEGARIQTASMNIELGGAVPSGFIKSYETICNRQYLYHAENNPEYLILIGAENGRVQTVFLMEPYQLNTETAYLEVAQTAFGGTTIQPIRYYSDKLLEGRLNPSASLLRNESTMANIVANAIRAREGLCGLIEKEDLTRKAEEQAMRVSLYNGDSSYWHNLGGNPGQRYGNGSYQSVNENITKGGMGSAHCGAVVAIDAYYTSPGHRQNLLAQSHAYIGTGIVYHGADRFTITQAYAK